MELMMARSGLRRAAKVFTISLRGPLTIGEPVRILERAIAAQLDRGIRRLRLDLRGVPFADACGLGALVTCLERAQRAGAILSVAGARGKLREEIRLTGLDRSGLRSRRLPADSRHPKGRDRAVARLAGGLPSRLGAHVA
jgi:anti-anti-sigma factor